MTGSAVLGGAFGYSRASDAAQDDPLTERLGSSVVQGGITAAAAAGIGGLAWKNRDLLGSSVLGTAKVTGVGAGRFMNQILKAKGLTGMLTHPLTVLGAGAVVGGLAGSKLSDNPVKGAAEGAAIGGVAAVAARGATRLWKGASGPGKAALLVAAAIGSGTATRAFTHEDAYAAEDHAVSDGTGDYDAEPGVRQRMNSLNASGDVVLGLHARRH